MELYYPTYPEVCVGDCGDPIIHEGCKEITHVSLSFISYVINSIHTLFFAEKIIPVSLSYGSIWTDPLVSFYNDKH